MGLALSLSVLAHGVEALAEPAAGAGCGGALFDQAKAAAAGKDWAEAYELFERCYTLQPSYDTAANLGHVALKLGRHAEAARYLAFSLERFPPSESVRRRAGVEQLLATAREQVGVIAVSLQPAQAQLLVDGKAVERVSSSAQTELFLEPGEHRLTASAQGYEPVSQVVTAAKGKTASVTLTLAQSNEAALAAGGSPGSGGAARADTAPAAQASGAGPATAGSAEQDRAFNDARRPSILPPLLIGGGVALVGLATGVGFTIAANHSKSDAEELQRELGADDSCSGSRSTDPRCAELMDAAQSVDRQRNISYVGFGVAGVAAVGTAVYLLWPLTAGYARIEPGLSVGARHGELSLSGRF
jgi:hypothetical protein